MTLRLRYILLPALLILISAAVFGQSAQITGRVSDTSGAVMTQVKVEVTNVRTGIVRRTQTNQEGYYAVPLLNPGEYRMLLRADGFKPSAKEGIVLEVDQIARIDFTLEIGAITESVTVEAGAPLTDVSTATLGKVVENRRIQELPLNGRNALALVMLTPAVKSNAGPTQSGFLDRGIALSSVSINGGVGATNSFLIDGANNNQPFHSDVNVNPTVDTVQEFKVQSNTMSAQYGFTGGGVVNVVTKSGTNELHGSLYHFVRNDAFDARNTFARTVAPFRYNQYGGLLGGPVVLPKIYNGKDRTFFFTNYEEWRHVNYQNPIFSTPTAEWRQGNFADYRDATGRVIPMYDPATTRANPNGAGFVRDPFAGNVIPSNRLDPVSVNMLQFYPLPNRVPTNAFTQENNYIANNSEDRKMWQLLVRGDHRITDNHQLSGRLMMYRHKTLGAVTGGVLPDPIVRLRRDSIQNFNIVISETATLRPNVLNEFRASVARLYFPFRVLSYGEGWPQKLGLPASIPPDTLPLVSNGLPGFVTQFAGLRTTLTQQYYDTLTWIKNNHTFTMGADFRIPQVNNYQPSNPSGFYNFPGALTGNPQSPAGTGWAFSTFLLGAVGNAQLDRFAGYTMTGWSLSGFFQDDWKVTPRFTLNLGLRYDYQTNPAERNNGVSNFNPFASNSENGLMGRMEYAGGGAFDRIPYGNNGKDFSPRVGFAYDVRGNGSTVIRGGFGIFYPAIWWFGSFPLVNGYSFAGTPYISANSNLPAFQFRNGLPFAPTEPLGARLGPSGFLGAGVAFKEGAPTPMSQQWNLTVQRKINRTLMVEAGYTANYSRHFWGGGYDYNQLDPKHLSLGLSLQDQVPNPYAGRVPGALGGATISREQSLKPFPYYTGINVDSPRLGSSNYHGFLLSVEKKMSDGFSLLASYTAGKLMSLGIRQPVDFGPVEQVTFYGYQNGKYNRSAEWSLDPTDVSQRLVLSGLYELPMGKGKPLNITNKVALALLGGWQLNAVATMQSGLPVVIRGANNNRADRPDSTGSSAKIDGRSAARWFDTAAFVNPAPFTFGNVGRVLPDVRSPGVFNIDAAVMKQMRLTERLNLIFRADAFNSFNHVNLGFPNTSFVAGPDGKNRSAAFGTIVSARDPRQLQLSLKLVF